jgi:hypothetical protein
VTNLATKDERQETKVMQGLNGNHMMMVAVACAIALALTMAMSRAGETPIYGPDGKYQGSVFDYGRTQTYTDRSGHFTGSAVNNGNGTTSFFGRNGNFTGSAGSSIDRAFNFGRGR